MSSDPSNPDDFTPRRPEGGVPYEQPGYDLGVSSSSEAVRGRVQLPAVFLIVVGVLNILFAFYQFFNVVVGVVTPAKDLQETNLQLSKAFSAQGANNPFANMPPDEFKTMVISMNGSLGGLAFLTSLLNIVGGIQMLRLRSYGLAIFASILAAIPCLSCTACCGLGEGIGIWALVVLLQPDVRAAFTAVRMGMGS